MPRHQETATQSSDRFKISTGLRGIDLDFHPLVVDLDGTLIRTEMVHECALRLLRDRPGKTACKRHLAVDLDNFEPPFLPLTSISWTGY